MKKQEGDLEMAEKIDLVKQLKHLYNPPKDPVVVVVLSDFRRTAPEKLRTVIRPPMR
jgi:hypothetical protein